MKVGYRTEQLYNNAGFLEADIAMAYEIFELCNVDILDTLSQTILKDTPMGQTLDLVSKYITDNVNDGKEVDWEYFNEAYAQIEDKQYFDFEDFLEYIDECLDDEDIAKGFCDDILDAIKNKTGEDVNYVLWLCDSIADLKNEYEDLINFPDIVLDEFGVYEVSNIILSDIGTAGKLYGYKEKPRLIKECHLLRKAN
jgi:hypothetical protein